MTRKQFVLAMSVAALLLLAGCSALLGGQEAAGSTPTVDAQSTDLAALTANQTVTVQHAQENTTPTATEKSTTTEKATSAATETPTATATESPAASTTKTATTTESQTATATATETDSSASTPTPEEPAVEVEGGDVPVDADRVYDDVSSMLGREAEPPTVEIVDTIPFMEGPEPQMTNEFRLTFGFGREYIDASVYHAYTAPQQGRIVVSPRNATEAEFESVLAHEYTHWLQFRGDPIVSREFGGFVDDTDSAQVRAGLTEGASVYLTDRYMAEYMNVSWNQTEALTEQYERGPPGRRLFRARYRFGAEYIHGTIDDPSNLSWLYRPETPTPETSEQLIHGETPESEPERNLTVSTNATDWSVDGRDTKGEIIVRTMLRVELNESTAAPASAGWGSDEIVHLTATENESREAFAWALRWDSSADADEFEAAFDRWIGERPANGSTVFEQRRLSDETVVVFAGDREFVENATVKGTTGNVTVGQSP